MSSTRTLKTLAFRVHLKPAPRTQSESNAVLRALQEFGPISTFQIPRRSAVHNEGGQPDDTTAILVFARHSNAVDRLRTGKSQRQFIVSANANIPDPKKEDPFNIRGLRMRKPAIQSRDIQCHIVPVERTLQAGEESVLRYLEPTEYTNTFGVDRNSTFAEILAKTDCPSGLIHGLLPRLEDRFRRRGDDVNSTRAGQEDTEGQRRETMPKSRSGQESGGFDHQSELLHLDQQDDGGTHMSLGGNHESVDYEKSSDTDLLYDEFENIRGVSLMQMYRKATAKTETANS